jgi:hypothetical protein
MSKYLSMEKRRDSLQKKLDEDLDAENAFKIMINREFEELKHLEVELEKYLEQSHSTKMLRVKH